MYIIGSLVLPYFYLNKVIFLPNCVALLCKLSFDIKPTDGATTAYA